MVLEQIADQWSILIIAALCSGPLRFNALRREVAGISQKSLTKTLKRLIQLGLVERTVLPVAPVAVEYEVTPLGESLKGPFQVLFRWTIEHAAELEAANDRYKLQKDVW